MEGMRDASRRIALYHLLLFGFCLLNVIVGLDAFRTLLHSLLTNEGQDQQAKKVFQL